MNSPHGGGDGTSDPYTPPRELRGPGEGRRPDGGTRVPPSRNYPLAIVMALVVFALLIGVRVLWGGMGSRVPTLPESQQEQTPAPSN